MAKTFTKRQFGDIPDSTFFQDFRKNLTGTIDDSFSEIDADFTDVYALLEAQGDEIKNVSDNMTPEDIGAAASEHNHDSVYSKKEHTHDYTNLENIPDYFEPAQHQHFKSEIADWPQTFPAEQHSHVFSEIEDIPEKFTPISHGESHKANGTDPINPEDIGAVSAPAQITQENAGAITLNVADNTEYNYTGVTGLMIVLNDNSAHGFITFGSSVTTPTYSSSGSGFYGGADITTAAAGEKWEFDTLDGCMLWRKWGVPTV